MPALLDILIIEDVPSDADAIEAELRGADLAFAPRRVDSRETFLAALGRQTPDLVLSDFTLPDFSALDALRLLKERKLEVPFILITGNRSEEVAVECIREGADDYILKASLRRLPTSLKNALEKRAASQAKAEVEAAARALPRLIREAQEAERRRVARDLHDSVNQILSAVKFRLTAVEEKLQERDEATWRDVLKAKAHLEKAMQEVRRISRNLRPSELDDLGLVPAVRSLCNEFTERTGVTVELAFGKLPQKIPGEVELNLYRVLQEALGNIERHAGARAVSVSLEREGAFLRAAIRDDGRGFDPKFPDLRGARPGMGLVDMRERAEFTGGRCTLRSGPGKGTEIVIEMPLRSGDNNRPKNAAPNPAEVPDRHGPKV